MKWHRLYGTVSVLVALSCAVQLLLPALSPATAAHAAPLHPAVPLVARAAPAPISDYGASQLQSALNLLVRQAVTANGWRVTALDSQITTADSNPNQQSGSGNWQLQVLDDKQQPLSLQGTLNYQIAAQANGNAITDAAIALNGPLQAAAATLTLDLKSQLTNSGGSSHNDSSITLQLARDGKTQTTRVNSQTATTTPAYNLTQAVTQSTLDRDGKTTDSHQTLTTRNLGRGETEVWLQADANGAGGATSMTRHFFQRVNGANVSQYLDRYDLKTADNEYSLQAPVTLNGSLDGVLQFNMTLVDANGKTININSAPSGTGLAPQRVPGAAMPLPANQTTGSNDATPPLADAGDFMRVLHTTPLDESCAGAAQDVILGAAGVVLAAVVILILMDFAPIVLLGGFVGAGQYATFEAVMMLGVGAMGGGFLFGWLCNADPYFVAPDTRTNADAVNPPPLQITRVTGGLVHAPPAVSSPPNVSPTTAANQAANVQYRDRAEIFVGGALPQGADAIGDWTWDTNRTFNGAASHTQAAGEGASQHYFIHATQPLTVTADDNIIQYVYLDPQKPPAEIYMQFYVGDGDGEHRAYWGKDLAQTGGQAGTASLYPMGALPAPAGWVRLKIPAAQLGLSGQSINGISFGTYNGQAWWGSTTTSSRLTDTAPDQFALGAAPALPTTEPGAQIAFRLSAPTALTIQIDDAKGGVVRTLAQNQSFPAGYQVLTWDAKNDSGAVVADQPYQAHFTGSGAQLADVPVTISPFAANISLPSAWSVVRGNDVPIFGEAYGTNFKSYSVAYGKGLNPTTWNTITESATPRTLPSSGTLSHVNAGNLANWNVGLDEITPWNDAGLNGVYTLRLEVVGSDGRQATDTFPVLVGRLADFPDGGTIPSADGKARLVVPSLATQNPFALLALAPLSQLEPDDSWKQILPTDKQLAGEVYEIFPPDETFRQPATLELPYAAGSATDKLGVMLGDGTANGWRYIGGTVDAQNQVIRVPISGFGSRRALVAPFTADNFGAPVPTGASAPPLSLESKLAAPSVTASSAPFAFYSDLASSTGEWQALDPGTQLTLVHGADAGLKNDAAALKVTRENGGVRLVQARTTPFDAAKFPLLSFDYRLKPGTAPNLLVKSNGTWQQFQMNDGTATGNWVGGALFQPASAPHWIADDAWHHYQFDLLSALRANAPSATNFQVDEIAFGQINAIAFKQYIPTDAGAVGESYYIANLAAHAPTNATALTFTLAAPDGTAFNAYSYALDQQPDTVPPTTASGASNQISMNLPSDGADGEWYLHVRGSTADGQWSAPAHFPILIDRQPPQVGNPVPAPNGAGAPDEIVVPITDATSGIDLSTLQVTVNGTPAPVGYSVRFAPDTRALVITPALLPTPVTLANGQNVAVSINKLQDYAGNALAQPFTWNFTADRPQVTADDFQQLTVDGGEAPAVSPDGTQVAFVSNRSGTAKLWVMRADDLGEKGKTAKQLSTDSAAEADPAWSPDGKTLAYVSDADGSLQVWSAAPDGSGAHALTQGAGGAASPAWSPDGKTLAFIRDGNLWQVNADGSQLRALTSYPERPLKTVKWQPDGQLFALDFKLYQETVDLYNPATGLLTPLTEGGSETAPAWLNDQTLLYTAPAKQNQPDAIWQINLDGTGAAVLSGSGQPGTTDMQPASARGGSALAIVSTRSGARNVWIRTNLQLARLGISPAAGAATGTPFEISYTLPADAHVTVEIANVKKLLDNVAQNKGDQSVTWDGTDANGKPLAPGDYVVQITAQAAGSSAPLTRYATVHITAPSDKGTLALTANQWANTPLSEPSGLQFQVYPQGARVQPVAEAAGNATPNLELAAGKYDVIVTDGSIRRELDGVQVESGKTTAQAIDLGLGELKVSLFLAPDHPVDGSALVQVSQSGDPTHATIAAQYTGVSNFVLPPGLYDVSAEYQGIQQSLYGVRVTAAQTNKQAVDLGAGTLALEVLGYQGKPADANGRLIVRAFRPNDHEKAIATDVSNPTQLLLPAGTYDLQSSYGSGVTQGAGGATTQWLNGVTVSSGETVSQTLDLHLGQVTLNILEADGKPAQPSNLLLSIYPHGNLTDTVGTILGTSSGTLELPAGSYDAVADYPQTNLLSQGAVATFQVAAGTAGSETINLKLGRITIQVNDASGKPIDPSGLGAQAFTAGTLNVPFSSAYNTNPLELPVRGDTLYDIQVQWNGKVQTVTGQSVKEGATLTLTLNAADFK